MDQSKAAAAGNFIKEPSGASPDLRLLALALLATGMHSVILGIFIYWHTGLFYQLCFQAPVENIFFVRQSGLFLFCTGLFYLALLSDLRVNRRLVPVVVAIKLLAVLFLVTNASLSARPAMVYLAACGDGCMGALLAFCQRRAGRGAGGSR